jgi:hypothetical protein
MDRLGDVELKFNSTAQDIYKHFGYDEKVQNAILNGSMGKYGVTYKLTTQVIGSWIYKSRIKKVNYESL